MPSINSEAGETRHALVGPAEYWKAQRDFQVRFLASQGLRPSDYLLDIGCGTLRGGIPLIRLLEPGHYYGIEVRREVLEQGREELREHQLEERLPVLCHTPALARVTFSQPFDFIWAFAVLIHMTDEIADDCVALAARSLAPRGRFYATVNFGPRPEGHWLGFPVVWRSAAFYDKLAKRNYLAMSDLGSMRSIRSEMDGLGEETTRILEFRHAG